LYFFRNFRKFDIPRKSQKKRVFFRPGAKKSRPGLQILTSGAPFWRSRGCILEWQLIRPGPPGQAGYPWKPRKVSKFVKFLVGKCCFSLGNGRFPVGSPKVSKVGSLDPESPETGTLDPQTGQILPTFVKFSKKSEKSART